MKQKMNKLMHYSWYYFWNIGVCYLILLPVLAVLLFLNILKESAIELYWELYDSVRFQNKFNVKAKDILKEKFKEKVI